MSDRFQACLAETLRWEGGWSNHPQDPGGATMKGVIQRVYDGWRERQSLPRQSVRSISDAELQSIYRENYWQMVAGDTLPAGLDLAVFDFGVNSGPTRAVRYLQACLGIAQDGHMGAVTITAANRADVRELIASYMAARRGFIRQIGTYPTFGKGWERRCNGIEAACLAMVGPAPPAPAPQPLPDADAQSESQGRATGEREPASGTVVGTVVAVGTGAGATVVNQTISAPPPVLTESLTNLGLWQQVGVQAAGFGRFVLNNPVEVGVIVTLVAMVWLAPRLLPIIWSRQA